MLTYYEILLIKETATQAEIREAYKKRMLDCHPDLYGGDEEKAKEYLKVKAAYDCLSDPERREAYDNLLKLARGSMPAGQQRGNVHGAGRRKDNSNVLFTPELKKFVRIAVILFAIVLGIVIAVRNKEERERAETLKNIRDGGRQDSIRIADSICAVEASDLIAAVEVEPDAPASPPSKSRRQQAQPAQPAPLPPETKFTTGQGPFDRYFGRGKYDRESLSELAIYNYTNTDAVVLLVESYGKEVRRNVFVASNSTFTMKYIPRGTYFLKIMQGKHWYSGKDNGKHFPKGGFMRNESFSQTSQSDLFRYIPETTSEGTEYPTYSVTLHKVENGNLSEEPIRKDEFFEL